MDNAATSGLRVESDELAGCAWVGDDDEHRGFHDEESGTPRRADRAPSEKLRLIDPVSNTDGDSPPVNSDSGSTPKHVCLRQSLSYSTVATDSSSTR
jgi:hypothetical protein